jgi:hypothetical protein
VATVGVGATRSTVIDNAADVVALPAASVSVTEILQVPSDKDAKSQELLAIVQETLVDPILVAVTTAVPANDPETLIVGVLSEVRLSVVELPESEAVSRSGVEGVPGAVVSTVIAFVSARLLDPLGTVTSTMMLPAASVGAEVNEYELTVKSALVSPVATV